MYQDGRLLLLAGDIECQSPAAPTSNALECHLNHSFPASSLQWSGISLSVRDRHTGNKKRLLQGCCGVAFPGDLVALVGPSGACCTNPVTAAPGCTHACMHAAMQAASSSTPALCAWPLLST